MFKKKKRQNAEIGDVCEIATPAGLAYVQYTHENEDMGELVRILPGLFSVRPTNLNEVAKQKELYFIFYTLNSALHSGQAEIVSHQPVPKWAQPYPIMRWTYGQGSKTTNWKLFSASASLTIEEHQKAPVFRELTREQQKLSIHSLIPHSVMVKELARGWTPERAEEFRLQDIAEAAARKEEQSVGSGMSDDKPMRHYLYFPKKKNAETAGKRLRERGFSVVVRMGSDGENWLAFATKAPPETEEQMDGLRDEMESLAEEFGGEYDGWELAFDSASSVKDEQGKTIDTPEILEIIRRHKS